MDSQLFLIKMNKLKDYSSKNKDKNLDYDLNMALDSLSEDDFFGTEGELDPRGDKRNGSVEINQNYNAEQTISNFIEMLMDTFNRNPDDEDEIATYVAGELQTVFDKIKI